MRRFLALALLSPTLACGASADAPGIDGAPLPEVPPVVDVVMREFGFELPGEVPAGRVVFNVHNAGTEKHTLDVIPLSEDVPPIDVQLQGSERRAVSKVAGVSMRDPEQSGTFAVDLERGQRYAVLCLLRDADGTSHAVKGMAAEFLPGTLRESK